jgi:hypothetical protein
MLVVSQRQMSQFQKDIVFTEQAKCLYLRQLSNFSELRYVPLKYDKCQKFDIIS